MASASKSKLSTSRSSETSASKSKSKRSTTARQKTTEQEGEQSVVISDEEQEASRVEPEEPAAEIPETITVPGRKRDKRPGPFTTSNLAGRVTAISTDLQQCARDFLNPAVPKIIDRFNDVYTHLCKISHQQTHLFLAEVQWKLVVTFNPMLWKSLGLRWASPTESAMYNLMATLPQVIMPRERLREKARKDIGRSTEFLEASADNRLKPQDIWRRMIRELRGLGGLDSNLRQLEGHKRTAIVARGLPNACAILRMLDEYAFRATRHHVERNLLELSDAGTLRVARFAHDMVSWHFGMEEVIVAALYMATKGRAACEGIRVIPAPLLAQSLEYYLCTKLYEPTIDIGFVECSCAPSVVERLKSCSNTQTIGNERRRWKTEEATAKLRTPAILCLGGCCSAFASGKNPNKDGREIDRFSERSRPQHDNMDRTTMMNLGTS